MIEPPPPLQLSGERFRAVYLLAGDEAEARRAAADLCVEQTVEFPADLLPPGEIPDRIVGRVESLRPLDADRNEAVVSFAAETAGGGLPQLLNVVFGHVSLKPGVRLQRLELPDGLLGRFRGPRFGRTGLYELLGAHDRPLLCTAVKPMGLPPGALADLAEAFARGGVDLVKDDHGLADQPFCPFEERVARVAAAVTRANTSTGGRCLYLPNVTGPVEGLAERARLSRDAGAGGVLLSPGLVGLDAMRRLADDDSLGLPILAHPALLGSFVVHPDRGVSHFALFGQLMRLAGADGIIFPHFGGRFSFSRADCRALADGTAASLGPLRPILPAPAGGMALGRVRELVEFYGRELILLIGGDLHRHGPDLAESCRRFRRLVESADKDAP